MALGLLANFSIDDLGILARSRIELSCLLISIKDRYPITEIL